MILVTGGTGSFGHAFVRSALARGQRVRVFSRDEEKQRAMARLHPEIEYMIGDVRDPAAVGRAMRRVTQVFHAAALKQVPPLEANPLEAVKTNIIGTENVCAAADAVGARVVVLSTDKAVEPVGVMGATKMLAERVARSWRFNSVRYGNVVGSRGSIIPLFREQMRKGYPITVTDPTMTRFLITLDEAIDLVWMAMEAPADGTVFVKKSPAATVAQIVRVMAPDHPTKVIGIRPGEKRIEHLVVASEDVEEWSDHFRVRPTGKPGHIDYSSDNAPRLTDDELAAVLAQAPTDDL